MILRNIGIFSCGKMLGAVGAGIGLAITGFFLLATVVALIVQSFTSRMAPQEPLYAFGAVLFLPVVYGLAGFAAGIVGAFSYNLLSGRLGGIELDLAPVVGGPERNEHLASH